MVYRFYIAFTFILALTLSHAQETSTIDSLKAMSTGDLNNQTRVDVYNSLSDHLWHSYPQQAIAYADSAYRLVSKLDYPTGRVNALANMGIGAYTNGQYEKAEAFYIEAIELSAIKNIQTDVHIYHVNLLKKQGKFGEIARVTSKLLPDAASKSSADPAYLATVVGVYTELGDVKEARKFIEPIRQSEPYDKDEVFRANANIVLSGFYTMVGKYDSAVTLLNEAIKMHEKENDKLGKAKATMQLGSVQLIKGRVKESRQLLEEALTIYEDADYPFGVAEVKRHFGEFYSTLAEFNRATELLFEALEIFEEQKNLNEIVKTYNELAWIYMAQGSYETSREFVFKATKLSREIGNKSAESYAYNTYGSLLEVADSLEASFKAYEKAYQLSIAAGDKKSIAASLFNMAYTKEQLGQYDQVHKMYINAYRLEEEMGNSLGMAISEFTLGSYHTNFSNFDSAIYYLDISRNRLLTLDAKDNLLANYIYSAELYTKLNNYKKANEYYRKYVKLKDTLITSTSSAQLTEMEVRYDLKNKEREIAYLNLENQNRQQDIALKEKTISNQRLFIILVVVASLLLSILLFVVFRLFKTRDKANRELKSLNEEVQEKNEEISAQAEELQEANEQISTMNEVLEGKVGKRSRELKQAYKELDTFFYKSSHDFRSPLTTFLGLAEVAKSTLKDDYSLDLFEKVKITALQLDKMVNKLKAISLITMEDLKPEDVNLDKVVNQLLEQRKNEINATDVSVEIKTDDINKFRTYKDLLAIIFDNLIENAIQYRIDGSTVVSIKMKQIKNGVRIRIQDSGQGIEDSLKEKVFEMYFRGNEFSVGNGLGLYLVKKAVERLRGDIQLESKLGQGTTVTINIPEIKG